MKYTIYKITNKINNKTYIGKHQTKDLYDGYMGSGKILRRAQKKHGIENFIKEILYIFDTEDEMNAKEKELVTEEFCLREDTYNICVGGQGGFSYINANKLNGAGRSLGGLTQKSRVSAQFKMQNASKEWHDKRVRKIIERHGREVFATFKGKHHTDETRQKMSISKRGKYTGSENSAARSVIADGVLYPTIKEAAAKLGIGVGAVSYRIKRGIYTSK